MSTPLDREEYIEQAYFFRTFRERLTQNLASQDILARLHEEVLSTTRLPMAIQFLTTELKHAGLLSSGFARLSHYFAPFQTFVIKQTEDEDRRFNTDTGLLILEREAEYRAGTPTAPGLFIYQFETISRNRLGYDEGLRSMASDPFYDADWKAFVSWVHRQVGVYDFAELLYARSALYVSDERRTDSAYEPPVPPLFAEKEGKIAKANLGRDPLYLFSALQRQLQYPEVPRPRPRDDTGTALAAMQLKLREMETRIKLLEAEVRGKVDLEQFAKPEILEKMPPMEDVI